MKGRQTGPTINYSRHFGSHKPQGGGGGGRGVTDLTQSVNIQ